MIRLVKCSLCGQIFNDDDQRIEQMKDRHEEYHIITHGKTREHNGKDNIITRNMIKGKVTWR